MTQIVFNSQKEFEDAVMTVLNKRLDVDIKSTFGGTFTQVTLFDDKEFEIKKLICRDSTRDK